MDIEKALFSLNIEMKNKEFAPYLWREKWSQKIHGKRNMQKRATISTRPESADPPVKHDKPNYAKLYSI